MTQYETRPISWIVAPAGEPTFSERATIIEIDDEAGGEFVVIRQQTDEPHEQRIAIDVTEWPALRAAINRAVRTCRSEKDMEGPL